MKGEMTADGVNSVAHEQFLVLAKSQKGRALVSLLEKVLESPKIFVFSELLEMKAVQDLRATEFASHYSRLELFAYGTYQQYQDSIQLDVGCVSELSDKMVTKLRQLSIVTLGQSSKIISYETLRSNLGIQNVREIEDLVLDTIYAGLLDGKLDQAKGVLNIKSCVSRDVRLHDIDGMIAKLSAWKVQIDNSLRVIDNNIANAASMQNIGEENQTKILAAIQMAQSDSVIPKDNVESSFLPGMQKAFSR